MYFLHSKKLCTHLTWQLILKVHRFAWLCFNRLDKIRFSTIVEGWMFIYSIIENVNLLQMYLLHSKKLCTHLTWQLILKVHRFAWLCLNRLDKI